MSELPEKITITLDLDTTKAEAKLARLLAGIRRSQQRPNLWQRIKAFFVGGRHEIPR